jgi:hypothetical protein
VPVAGRKPKPEDQRRNRVKPVHGWTDVVATPYAGKVPPLPRHPRHADAPTLPDPARPLARMGSALWERAWRSAAGAPVDAEALLVLCEQMDERVALRVKVLQDPTLWRSRNALRAVDGQISTGLAALGLASARTIPAEWPPETKRWWRAVSRMPHCLLWAAADWQFALDTALVAAAFHCGDVRVATELRQRERIMGTTVDARRDLRIRYVEPVPDSGDSATVTIMDAYRQLASGGQG